MGRTRALVITAAAVLGILWPSVAAAQVSDPPPDSGSTTTEPPTTTVPPVTEPGDPTVPPETPTTEDPGTNGDAPSETVPPDDATIPDRPVPDVPGATAPPRARAVLVDVKTARKAAIARQAAYAAAVAHRTELEASLAELQAKVNGLASEERRAVADLTEAHDALVDRAVDAYVTGRSDIEAWAVGDDDMSGQRTALLSAVAERDRAAVDRYEAARARVTHEQADTALALTDTQAQLDLARTDEAAAQLELGSAQLELAVTTAGGNIVIHGFVFPVAAPHTFSEDFGDARLPGTAQAHTHQGCDVVAAEGTELYAAERGAITQLSSGGLGGNGLWLKGESGTYYYYAHLSAYVLGLQSGTLVEAGQLVGYVGHTGDAYGPHLHFEVHPGGGAAVDPYPILLATDPQPVARP